MTATEKNYVIMDDESERVGDLRPRYLMRVGNPFIFNVNLNACLRFSLGEAALAKAQIVRQCKQFKSLQIVEVAQAERVEKKYWGARDD